MESSTTSSVATAALVAALAAAPAASTTSPQDAMRAVNSAIFSRLLREPIPEEPSSSSSTPSLSPSFHALLEHLVPLLKACGDTVGCLALNLNRRTQYLVDQQPCSLPPLLEVLTGSPLHAAVACLVFLDIGLPDFRHLAFCVAVVCALKYDDGHVHAELCARTWSSCVHARHCSEAPNAATFLDWFRFFEHEFLQAQHPRLLQLWKLLEVDEDTAAHVLPFTPRFPPSNVWRQAWFPRLESEDVEERRFAACVLQHYSADLREHPSDLPIDNCIRLMQLPGRWHNFACNGPRVVALQQHTPRLFQEVCWHLVVVWGHSFEVSDGSFELPGVGAEDPAGVLAALVPYVNSPGADQRSLDAIKTLEANSPVRQFFAHKLRWTWIRAITSISLEKTAIFEAARRGSGERPTKRAVAAATT